MFKKWCKPILFDLQRNNEHYKKNWAKKVESYNNHDTISVYSDLLQKLQKLINIFSLVTIMLSFILYLLRIFLKEKKHLSYGYGLDFPLSLLWANPTGACAQVSPLVDFHVVTFHVGSRKGKEFSQQIITPNITYCSSEWTFLWLYWLWLVMVIVNSLNNEIAHENLDDIAEICLQDIYSAAMLNILPCV